MTNWETFILVLIVLAGTVGPFAVAIFVSVKHSNDVYKVLKEPRTYRTPWTWVLLSTDSCLAFVMIFLAGLCCSVLLNLHVYPSNADWQAYALISAIMLMCLYLAFCIHSININHWQHLKNLTLTFDPQSKTVWIKKNGREYVIRADTISEYEIVSTGNFKLPLEFYKLILADGDHIYLPGKARGAAAIFEYFKKIPSRHIRKRFTFIPKAG